MSESWTLSHFSPSSPSSVFASVASVELFSGVRIRSSRACFKTASAMSRYLSRNSTSCPDGRRSVNLRVGVRSQSMSHMHFVHGTWLTCLCTCLARAARVRSSLDSQQLRKGLGFSSVLAIIRVAKEEMQASLMPLRYEGSSWHRIYDCSFLPALHKAKAWLYSLLMIYSLTPSAAH